MFDRLLTFAEEAVTEAFPLTACYRDYRPQAFTRPAFTLAIVGGRLDQGLDRRYALTCKLRVRYYAPLLNAEGEADLYGCLQQTALTLYDVLSYPGATTQEMSHTIDDKALDFEVSYKLWVEKTAAAADDGAAPKMASLSLTPDI